MAHYLASAEVYDPGADTWTAVASLNTARDFFTATLLPSGKVLVAGGYADSAIAGAEVFDRELEFDDAWRPVLNRISSPLTPGQPLRSPARAFAAISIQKHRAAGRTIRRPTIRLSRFDAWIMSNGCGCRPARLATPRTRRCLSRTCWQDRPSSRCL